LISVKIYEQKNKRIKGIKIRNYTLFDAKSQVNALINLNSIIKWFILLFIVYISIPLLFGVFPWTKNLGATLFGYVLTPLKRILFSIIDYLPNLITIAVIIFVFRYVLRGIKYLKSEIELERLKLPGFYPDWASPTYQIIRVLVVAFMIVVIFPYLPGSDSPIFKGVSVFLGFLFTFGSAGSLSNLISGIILTYMRLYKIGDRIKIGNTVGDVVEKNILVTRIKTIKNEIVSVPNSTVMSSHTVNYTVEAEKKGLIVHSTVTIGYDVPWNLVHQALIEAAQKTEYVLEEPKPFVLQTSLNDFYVSYEINAYTHQASKQALIYSELHQHIQDSCNAREIEIMSPHYTAARDGNTKAVPEEYLPKDYTPGGFIFKKNQ
jgi:small-conductance mechanosensitive channel